MQRLLGFMAGCLALAMVLALPAGADTTEITIYDETSNSTRQGENGGTFTNDTNSQNEDNEVERGNDGPSAIATQEWDLEGFFWNDGSGFIGMVGGWDWVNNSRGFSGFSPEQNPGHEGEGSGDIFLSVGVGGPDYGDNSASPWNYNFVMDIDWEGATDNGGGSYSVSFDLIALTPPTGGGDDWGDGVYELGTTVEDSDPFRYHAAGNDATIGSGTILVQLNAASPITISGEGAAYNFDGDSTNDDHHQAWVSAFDTTWFADNLNDDTEDWYVHHTMFCGNDNLMGAEGPSFDPPIPEPASIALLGIGMAGLALRKRFVA